MKLPFWDNTSGYLVVNMVIVEGRREPAAPQTEV